MIRILYISNYRKGIGGISEQVDQLVNCLRNERVKGLKDECYKTAIFSTKANPLVRVYLFFKLLYVARQYDVLHIHACSEWGMLPAVYGIIAGKIWHKRIIITYHGGGAANYFEGHGKFARRWLNRADRVIVLNGYLEKVFKEYNIPCVVIPNVIELRQDIYRAKTEICPKLISVRHLTDLYRIDLIIRAFAKVAEKYPEAKLDILGQGDKRAKLVELVKELEREGVRELGKKVRFVGLVPNEQIYDYMRANDIMISAPYIDNMPVSIMEAMNAGLLVISSRVGGVPYMIEHRKTGLLFDGLKDEEVKGLTDEILWALEHQMESIAMIENAHQDVQKYSWQNVRKQMLPLIISQRIEK